MNYNNNDKPVPEEELDEILSAVPEEALDAAWRGMNLKELYEAEINPEKKAQYKVLMEQAEKEFLKTIAEETPSGELN